MGRRPVVRRRVTGPGVLLGCLLPVVLVVAVAVSAYVVMRRIERSDQSHPAAAPPRDLCAVLAPAVVERLVPYAERVAEQSYSSATAANGDAGCAYVSAARPAGVDRYGSLRLRVLRHGQVAGASGVSRAGESYRSLCADPGGLPTEPAGVAGLGDEACLEAGDGSDRTGSAFLRVRRGADLFEVDYSSHPSDARTVTQNAVGVARTLLAAV